MKKIICIMLCISMISLSLVGCKGEKPKELTDEDINTYTANMSDNIYSGDITINGIKHTLPVTISEMKDNGFNLDSVYKPHQQIKSNTFYEPITMDYPNSSGKSTIRITFCNDSNSDVDIDDAKIYKMEFNGVNSDYINTIVLPKGITPKSTYNDILNAYGNPSTYFIAAKAGNSIKYEGFTDPHYSSISFDFESDNETIKNIIINTSVKFA